MQSAEHFGQSFVISREPAEPCQPAEASLHHPAPGQQHEALLHLGQLHDLQVDAVVPSGRRRRFARVALIRPGQLHRVARGLLHVLAQPLHCMQLAIPS